MSRTVYMIAINDCVEVAYIYGVPTLPEIPRTVYGSYTDAKKAIMEVVSKFKEFTPVAYGDAYPYENTTFDKEMSQKEYALIGWVSMADPDDEESSVRIPIGLLKFAYSG